MGPKATPRVILHIGYGKTGTTALQSFLAFNRKSLASEGICYPDLRHRLVDVGITNHNWFAWAVIGKHAWVRMSDISMLRNFDARAAKQGAHSLLLSAEALALEPHPWEFKRPNDFWLAQQQKVARLRELFAGREVRVIVYLRRQDLWAESAMNHAIKVAGLTHPSVFQTVTQFLDVIAPCLDYARLLDIWSKAFGDESIEVAPYEHSTLGEGSVIDEFSRRLSLRSTHEFSTPRKTAETTNPGLSRDLLEFKRILNLYRRTKYEERFLAQALQEISSELPPTRFDHAPLISKTQRRQILETHEPINQVVTRRYCKFKDDKLFHDPWRQPADDLPSYPGLSAERAVEIYQRLQKKRRSFTGRKKVFEMRFKEYLRYHSPEIHAVARAIVRLARKSASVA